MLHHDAEAGDVAADRVEHAVDEHGLAVEDVDGGVGDLAVDEERQADLGHASRARGGPWRSRVTPECELVVAPAG